MTNLPYSRSFPAVFLLTALAGFLALGCGRQGGDSNPKVAQETPSYPDTLRVPGEVHLRNIRQLTFGGENAEAYFSPNGQELVLQRTAPPYECDQIFRLPVEGGDPVLVSNGRGRTTCSYFMPDGVSILYASTFIGSADCPPRPDYSQGYVWAIYPDFDIFVRTPADSLVRLTDTPGYDAEATVSPRGDRIVFTSMRDGDLDIYTMNLDGTGVKRLTRNLGYDGGPFFSPDGSEIVYRAAYPQTGEDQADYKRLLGQNLIRPSRLSLYVMKSDGSDPQLVLENDAANFAPYFFPDGCRIIFSSNMDDPKGRNFDLYMINKDGSELERITFNESFDGFPMFSPDGRRLVFASNRNNVNPEDTNIFIADWVE
jgi:Tol biopolymer transport system component